MVGLTISGLVCLASSSLCIHPQKSRDRSEQVDINNNKSSFACCLLINTEIHQLSFLGVGFQMVAALNLNGSLELEVLTIMLCGCAVQRLVKFG
ncbi:hypothetical protein Prudu_007768 [Prunus dulcis]|uniref:Uncharacterized protein n=1 Tax=Prunus dulcis TaxID=3755 RepID=A0A4Y1R2N1_PRUDU|nr:hypothetical protein Prudu_007768 [Prunus dulcis]